MRKCQSPSLDCPGRKVTPAGPHVYAMLGLTLQLHKIARKWRGVMPESLSSDTFA